MDNILKEDWEALTGYIGSPLWGKDDLPNLNKEMQLANNFF